MNKIKFITLAFTFVLAIFNTNVQAQAEMKKMDKAHKMAANPMNDITVIELTQTPGELSTKSLDLKPGKYKFVVTNESVDHEVGFVIQKASDKDGDVMKTAVANSFTESMIGQGKTASSGIVELTEGDYVYSCPLNPTPKYTLKVAK